MSKFVATENQNVDAAISLQQRGVNRILKKLDQCIAKGEYYEAHQMYRTLYYRYWAQQKYNDCMLLLHDGAQKLISQNQNSSAADLGILLVDSLETPEANKSIESEEFEVWMERLCSIIGQLSPNAVERETLIHRVLKWSGDVSGAPLGHPFVHKYIAQVFWSENNIEQARHHYLLCFDGNLCGRVIVKISLTKGYPSETDLFIVQAVLQQLCLKNLKAAQDTFTSYCKTHPKIRRTKPYFKQPLLNFLYYLFSTIESGNKKLSTFRALCEIYKPSLKRDPAFEKYLSKIGMHFFGAPLPQPFAAGLFGGMFSDLFTRLFHEDDDEEDENNANDARRAHHFILTRNQTRANELD